MLKIKQLILFVLLSISSITLINNSVANDEVPPDSIEEKITSSTSNTKIGNISWYGGHHHGKKTASGEVFNKYKLTTAHMHLPFGTKVKMTCVSTGKSVIVKVNDRGNFAKYDRAFDVSEGAAKALGFVNRGIIKVKYEILN